MDLLFDSAMSSSRPDRALHCSADSVVIRSEMYRLAGTWIPPADTITIGPLTEDRPPFDRPVREGPLAVEHLDSAVLAHSDVDAMLMDTETKEPLLRVSPEQSRIASATWAAAPGLVAMGLDNGRLQIWRATAASATMVDLVAHVRPVDEMDVSADGRLLLTGDSGGTVKLWPLMSVEDLLAEETLAGTP